MMHSHRLHSPSSGPARLRNAQRIQGCACTLGMRALPLPMFLPLFFHLSWWAFQTHSSDVFIQVVSGPIGRTHTLIYVVFHVAFWFDSTLRNENHAGTVQRGAAQQVAAAVDSAMVREVGHEASSKHPASVPNGVADDILAVAVPFHSQRILGMAYNKDSQSSGLALAAVPTGSPGQARLTREWQPARRRTSRSMATGKAGNMSSITPRCRRRESYIWNVAQVLPSMFLARFRQNMMNGSSCIRS